MRTQNEILARIDKVKEDDFFGFQRNDLIDFLDFENAKPFLKDGVTDDKWKVESRTPRDVMIEYMPFAWEKANDKRGLSSARTIEHYKTWLWLDGNEDLSLKIENYQYYGKPQLIMICEYLGLDYKQWDDGVRQNS